MEIVKLRIEIREALKEEGYQGNELRNKIDEVYKQKLQERIRQDEERRRKDEKRRAEKKENFDLVILL